METFDQVENKRDFKKIIWIVAGVAFLAGITVLFIFLGRGSKETINVDEVSSTDLISTGDTIQSEKRPLFSSDVLSWRNYYWPEKVNIKYPSNWRLEEVKSGNQVSSLKIIPPTGNPSDTIYIGSTTCIGALEFSTNKCLKNKIQVPFYTDSQNEEVLAAFDLVFQNSILTEEGK